MAAELEPSSQSERDSLDRGDVVLVWLFASMVSATLLVLVSVFAVCSSLGDTARVVLLLLSWGGGAAMTATICARVLGAMRAVAASPARRADLRHLPPNCVRLVAEALAIRTELAQLDHLDDALARAWALVHAVDRAPPNVRAQLADLGATLEPIHALFELHSRPRRSRSQTAQLRDRLAEVLRAFESALARPNTRGFR